MIALESPAFAEIIFVPFSNTVQQVVPEKEGSGTFLAVEVFTEINAFIRL